MFSCDKCEKVYVAKNCLMRHRKIHDGIRFKCYLCSSSFSDKCGLVRHVQKIHHLVKYGVDYNIAIGNHADSRAMSTSENVNVVERMQAGPSAISPKRRKQCNTDNTIKCKRVKMKRLLDITTSGFHKTGESLNSQILWFYKKNIENIAGYQSFLSATRGDLVEKLRDCLKEMGPIKFNLKLEATYTVPNNENKYENRSFKTSEVELINEDDIDHAVDISYTKLLEEQENYAGKGSNFSFSNIDGILLGVYKYQPLGGSSYIDLPHDIKMKKAVINPQNIDQQCFKWAILAKKVTEGKRHIVEQNYKSIENSYNFSGLSFPTPISDIKMFEKNNPHTSVNVYGLKLEDIHNKPKYLVYPLKVCAEERRDHIDLLIVSNAAGDSHYTYITDFGRLVQSQITKNTAKRIFCKRCFTGFNNVPKKYKLRGVEALEEHKKICGENKPFLPIMPEEGTILKFESWGKTQEHPFAIYADFESLLVKSNNDTKSNTNFVHEHVAMSYGYIVKAADSVPTELLQKFNIQTTPKIYRGNKSSGPGEVANRFMDDVTEVALKIEE
ncbi:uncharacterized protein LOC126909717 [Daktulosphaira vitifoliae]|uniref:uncharacterized protein LOC126909717 n=1 Tax=Daktulosphaira vitifoliae TaxID=58002 RepID=UPI0021A982D5|nr:uncharacterized protein LOC126909717 [Daktulosphaira vitifoliae]